jgi:hypothetical protein
MAADDNGGVAFAGEALCDRATQRITGPDHDRRLVRHALY